MTRWSMFSMLPSWLWYLFYLYLIIAPHILFTILIVRSAYDTFIRDPTVELEIKQKKEKEWKLA